MKYLVLKIAGGVFFGILAAFLVFKGIDVWESHERERLYAERQRQEADALEKRIGRASLRIYGMSPDKLIGLCGPPLRDRFEGIRRTMDYTGADGHTVSLGFLCSQGTGCLYVDMHRDRSVYDLKGEAYETYMMANGEMHPANRESVVRELPCLIGLP